MRKFISIVAIAAMVASVVACSNQMKDGKALQPNTELSKALTPEVGDPIAVTQAASWITAYQQMAPPELKNSHEVNRQTIESLLNLKYNGQFVDGLRFLKAINTQGETLIVIPVQGGNDLWYLSNQDSNERNNDKGTAFGTTGPIDAAIAQEWVNAYRASVSSETHRSYFVGREALTQALSVKVDNKPADGLRFYKALNEKNLETFIVVPVQNGLLCTLSGKSFSETYLTTKMANNEARVISSEYVFDFTSPCPPTCPTDCGKPSCN